MSDKQAQAVAIATGMKQERIDRENDRLDATRKWTYGDAVKRAKEVRRSMPQNVHVVPIGRPKAGYALEIHFADKPMGSGLTLHDDGELVAFLNRYTAEIVALAASSRPPTLAKGEK